MVSQANFLALPTGGGKRACALRTSGRHGRRREETKQGLAIERQVITEIERRYGKFAVKRTGRASVVQETSESANAGQKKSH